MKIYKLIIVAICFFLIIYCFLAQKNKIKELGKNKYNADSLTMVIDSLNNELFIKELEVNRYEIGIEIFEEKYPESLIKFEECLKNIE